MQLHQTLSTSIQILVHNRLRSGLTMLGIVIGIAAVILISSIGQGAVAFITQELSVFGTNFFRIVAGKSIVDQFAAKSDPLTLEDADALRAAQIGNVLQVVPIATANRTVGSEFEEVTANVTGVTAEITQIMQPNLIYGEFFSQADNDGLAKVAVLGRELAEELFGADSDPTGEFIRIGSSRFKVVGVTSSVGGIADIFNDGLSVPINSLISEITGKEEIFQIMVSIEDESLLNQATRDAEEVLREHRGIAADEDSNFFIQSFKETLSRIETITGLLTAMITLIAGISLVVGGVGVMNIMLVSVTERTREIGLLKAIGAKDQDILIQFLIEAVMLTLLGGLAGIGIGIGGAAAVARLAGIPFVVSPLSVLAAAGVSSLVGVVFGLYPARRAARLSPIEALRYE